MNAPASSAARPRAGLLLSCLRISLLLAVVVAAFAWTRPPAPRAADAPSGEFSAQRALRHLPSIASRPHPIGSAENARVRAYLLAQLRALGLQPQVQKAFIAKNDAWGAIAGNVHNVVVRVPGREAGKAVLLVAHYDSVSTGPGAADNGASVAAILETLRALRAGAPLRNDVIALFTDGEEAELLGAEAFVAQHPWARRAGLALNFEFRGNRGAVTLFETSAGNGRLVEEFADAVPHPLGSSLWYELYRHMPNDTDLSVFKRAGIAGLNQAAAEGHTHYHTGLDRIDQVAPGSVQHLGDNMLALTRRFGDLDLDRLQAGDRVYFSVAGLGMLSYDYAWVLPLSALALGLMAWLLHLGRRRGAIRLARVGGAVPLFVLTVALAAALCQGVWQAALWLHPGYANLLQGDTYNSHWYLLAFVALAVALVRSAVAALSRWCTPLEFAMAAMLAWLLLLGALSVSLPGASYVALWPLLAMQAAGLLVLARWRRGSAPGPGPGIADSSGLLSDRLPSLALAFAAVPALALFTALLWTLFVAVTPAMAFVIGAAAACLSGLLVPLFGDAPRRPAWRVALWLLVAAMLAVGSATSGFDRAHPRQNSLMYAQDAASGQAYWLSRDPQLDAWTGHYIGAPARQRTLPAFFGADSEAFWVGPAPAVLPAPLLRREYERQADGVRTLGLRIASSRHAPRMMLSVEGATVLGARLNTVVVAREPREDWMLDLYALDPGPALLELRLKAGQAYRIRLVDVAYAMPMIDVARPADTVPQPFMLNGASLVRAQLGGGAEP